jgi:hypothetical protein
MPISKNMNTKNKNARHSEDSESLILVALVQSDHVFTTNILQKYTDLPTKQVKTSGDPKSIFRFMVSRIKEDGTKYFILHLNDEDLIGFVTYLEEKLTSFKKYRSLFKEVQLIATLSTSDNVRLKVASTKYVKHFFQFLQSPLSVVLSTFEVGSRTLTQLEEPVKKTSLVILSDKKTSYYNQAVSYFSDAITTKVKKMLVSELPLVMDLVTFSEADLFLDNAVEMKKVAKFLDDNKFTGYVNLVNPVKDMLKVSEFQNLLGKKGLNIKSICSGVKNNTEQGKYSELQNFSPYETQVLETIKTLGLRLPPNFGLPADYKRCLEKASNRAQGILCVERYL